MKRVSRGELRRLTAFSTTPDGGNPAGVWVGPELPGVSEMQRVAREVGYSETSFFAPSGGGNWLVRYYSPEAEVSFCGHATIAGGVALAEANGEGVYQLETPVGIVPVEVEFTEGVLTATLTSVEPEHHVADRQLTESVLTALGWSAESLDPAVPVVRAYAGAWHLILALRTRARLAELDYDFDRLKDLMERDGLTTIQIVWSEDPNTFHSRNPFPVGGVVEDPATGAAAAALGGYLRDAGLVSTPATITIRQGEDMGRPSVLTVAIPPTGGVRVSGPAVDLT